MPLLLWDACALVKRYTREIGCDTVDALFLAAPRTQMVLTLWGYIETFAILLRRHNGGAISQETFEEAASSLVVDIMFSGEPTVLSIDDETLHESLAMIHAHNLNSINAALLTTFLHYATSSEAPCVLVTQDRRLLRAAQREGFATIAPEDFPASDVPAFLAALDTPPTQTD